MSFALLPRLARRGDKTLQRLGRQSRSLAPGMPPPTKYSHVLKADGGINPRIEAMQYAVRGELVLRAEALARDIADGKPGPVKRVTYCNIGNPQSVGQMPVTYVRQVLAAVVCPDTLLSEEAQGLFPDDVVARAEGLLTEMHGIGAYTESKGVPAIRQRVAAALEERDNTPADAETIFLTNGASEAVKAVLSMLVRDEGDGIMIPVPQYPLYSATLDALGARQVRYYLDEDADWAMSVVELERRIEEAKAEGVCVRALCVINPGNPTGQTLGRGNMAAVVDFAEKHNIVLLADEVYQTNVYDEDVPFHSFKSVVTALHSKVELASFHSISKGVLGECGVRGGFVELHNFATHAVDTLYKTMSVSLCANVPGQVVVDLMMTPPVAGEPSYELYHAETTATYEALRRKGLKLADALNSFPGVSCNQPQGAMYLFPQIIIPAAAVAKATEEGYASPDVLYSLELLEATGICVVPGSGFAQVPGTLHFRTTFLPPEEQMDDVIDLMRNFHTNFLAKYDS